MSFYDKKICIGGSMQTGNSTDSMVTALTFGMGGGGGDAILPQECEHFSYATSMYPGVF